MLIVDMPIGADLVDRAVLYERLKQWQDAAYDTVTLAFLHEVKMLIGSAPHIKAVELVRCKDCIEYRDSVGACHYFNYEPTDEMDFCSHGIRADGERRSDEQQSKG
jgi:hypothetical protein